MERKVLKIKKINKNSKYKPNKERLGEINDKGETIYNFKEKQWKLTTLMTNILKERYEKNDDESENK